MYVVVDFFSAALAWMFFFIYRKSHELGISGAGFEMVWNDVRLYQGLALIPLAWLLLYSMYGYYRKPFSKTISSDILETLKHSISGVIVLFFIVILDDHVMNYAMYYDYVFILFALHFGLTLFGRIWHTHHIRKAIRNKQIDVQLYADDDPLPAWQNFLKRIIDIVLSLFLGILLSPLILLVIWKVKRSSEGSVFYVQERVGLNEKPFWIYKFRSMYEHAESDEQPLLSSDSDERVTPFGRFMRKYRIDELPQLWNVLKGNMSLVGPRPERQYYIEKIVETAPEYKRLLRVKPGLTSLGEVKYGYASSVPQMIERMAFDLEYIENMSLLSDLKILLHTIVVVLSGEGK